MVAKALHLTYRKDEDQWSIKSEGAKRAAGLFDTKQKALDAGRQIARNQRQEFVIHNRNNVISDKDSYGHDPCPPRDRIH